MTRHSYNSLAGGKLIAVLALTCGALGLTSPCSVSAAGVVRVEAGFGGVVKAGYWTSVWVDIEGPFQGRLVVEAEDSDGIPVRFIQPRQLSLDEGQHTVTCHAKVGGLNCPLHVVAISPDGSRQRHVVEVQIVPASDALVVLYGDVVVRARQGRNVRSLTRWPEHWIGWESVDHFVMGTGDQSAIAAVPQSQVEALDHWLRLGGRMTWTVGSNGQQLLTDGSPWSRFAPGTFVRVDNNAETAGIEGLIAAGSRLNTTSRQNGFGFNNRSDDPAEVRSDGPSDPSEIAVSMTVLRDVRGLVDAYDTISGNARVPALIRTVHGLGQIQFLAIDLDLPPLRDWDARDKLVERLLGDRTHRDTRTNQPGGTVTHFGYDDLSGQLRSAMDQFSGVALVPFSWIVTLTLLFVAVIGPVDFFVLRYLGRSHWTWITFPVVCLLVIVLAIWLARQYQGQQLRLNQIDLVDLDMDSGTLRGTSWTNVYSPRSDLRSFTATPQLPGFPETPQVSGLNCWQSIPGQSLGGLSAASRAAASRRPYEIESIVRQRVPREPQNNRGGAATAIGRIIDLPLQHASSKAMLARWWSQSQLESDTRLSAEARRQSVLRGQVQNPLSVPLTNCRLAFRDSQFSLEKLEPGQTVQLSSIKPRKLRFRLVRRNQRQENASKDWDQRNLDVPRVMEMMMFHDAAGGKAYTDLDNRYQGYVDLSEHLDMNRAVLVGSAAGNALQISSSTDPASNEIQETQHWTFYRFVFPVEILE